MSVTDCTDDGLFHTKDGVSRKFVSFNSLNDCVNLFARCAGLHDDHHGGGFLFIFLGRGFPAQYLCCRQFQGRGDLAPT